MLRNVTLERLWSWLQHERFALFLSATLLVLAAAPLGLPQIPDTIRSSPEALRAWLAPWQLLTSLKLTWVARLGLFSLYRSLWLKLPLALLGLAVVVRAVALGEQWPGLTLRRRCSALATLAGMILLLGSGLQQWTAPIPPTLQVWPDMPPTLPDGETLSLPRPLRPFWSKDTLYIPRHHTMGLIVEAYSRTGQPLLLTPTAHAEGVPQLRFVFDSLTAEAFCAQPDSGLVFRMYFIEPTDSAPLHVEIYRAATGELISSTRINRSVHIFTEEVMLNLRQVNVQYVDGITYPGWPWFAVGLGLLLTGQVEQRFRRSC